MSIFDINPDITRAETLAADFYTDERYFHESKEKIFARTWQFVGTADGVEQVEPVTILEDFLDEPVVITSDGGRFHCLSNVCTHRGKILVEKPCRASLLRCGYHGRRFDLSGKFLSMPEFEEAVDFPSERDDLRRVPFGAWDKFLFASINPAAPLEAFLAEMREKLRPVSFNHLRFSGAKDYLVRAHWALYCENYLEGFHIPFVHQGLNEVLDFGSYATETFRYASLQTGFAKNAEPLLSTGASAATDAVFDFDPRVAGFYFFIFPNLMFNFYPWGLSINVVRPLRPDLTRVSYLTFISDESRIGQGAGGELETVEYEDQAVVESVQKGIRSRFYDRGRYSPTREQGTHHFHRLIAEFMNAD